MGFVLGFWRANTRVKLKKMLDSVRLDLVTNWLSGITLRWCTFVLAE
jgi:hypothetical protein